MTAMLNKVAKAHDTPSWLFWSLTCAGVYNIAWGGLAILFPTDFFQLFGMTVPNYPELWQCIGMIVGVYGLGYIIAASDPIRHWPIILVGLLGKVFGPMGFAQALWNGTFPFAFGINIILNDLVWWYPFAYSLWLTRKKHLMELEPKRDASALLNLKLPQGTTIGQSNTPTLVVALRHHGCIFTKALIAQLQTNLPRILRRGWQLVIVHMDATDELQKTLESKLGSEGWVAIEDSEQQIYRNLGARRGKFSELFGWQEWTNGMRTFFQGHGIGPLRGDGTQLAGMALIAHQGIQCLYLCRRASERLPIEDWVQSLEVTQTTSESKLPRNISR